LDRCEEAGTVVRSPSSLIPNQPRMGRKCIARGANPWGARYRELLSDLKGRQLEPQSEPEAHRSPLAWAFPEKRDVWRHAVATRVRQDLGSRPVGSRLRRSSRFATVCRARPRPSTRERRENPETAGWPQRRQERGLQSRDDQSFSGGTNVRNALGCPRVTTASAELFSSHSDML
jgi:hypothetical protein